MELEKVRLPGDLLKAILVETRRGKSLGGILRDYVFSQIELSGKVLDLGSDSDSPSCRQFIRYR